MCSSVTTVPPRTTLSPSSITSQSHPCPHGQQHLQGQKCPQLSPQLNCVPRTHQIPQPATSPRPTMSLRPVLSLRPVVSPGLLSLMVQGFPAQSIYFGLLLSSVAGRAILWAGHHCLVLPMSPRDQPGHQIRVRSPCEEEHRGQNCGDPRWRGGKSSFVSPTFHPHLPTGCPQETCTWGHHPRAPRAAQAGGQ